MRRREFIAGLGTAAAWPVVAQAQQRIPVIGYLYSGFPESAATLLSAFRKGLSDIGYIEGQNVAVEYRWAENHYDRVPELAADLVRRRVAVISTFGGAVLAAKAATTTIPIVFSTGGDPVALGLVASLNRPGGNMTGVTTFNSELAAKRLGFVHNLLPRATHFAVLVNSNEPTAFRDPYTRDAQGAALAMGWQIEVLTASTNSEIDTAFASLVQKRADALLVSASSLFRDRRVQLAMLAVRHAVPAIYVERGFTEAGGLMSYGSSLLDQRQIGVYVGRILNGAKPADLPLMQSTKFELVINLQTAKTLGLTIPETLLATADEVIQ